MNIWCRRHCDEGAKEIRAARYPKTGPPGREGTKVKGETMGNQSSQD
ncbi:hypothetical protein [Pontibacter populi]|uniref:Uncharacterized protein n=1 Tax=Pontibacter populi TaxID=890055 RepID=A0ABV1RS38_9BACT